jgi:hypothetical protein
MAKIHPKKSAENAHMMGSWQHAGLRYKWSRKVRSQWHRARTEGRLGEQLDRSFRTPTGKQERKNQAARMKRQGHNDSLDNMRRVSALADWNAE